MVHIQNFNKKSLSLIGYKVHIQNFDNKKMQSNMVHIQNFDNKKAQSNMVQIQNLDNKIDVKLGGKSSQIECEPPPKNPSMFSLGYIQTEKKNLHQHLSP